MPALRFLPITEFNPDLVQLLVQNLQALENLLNGQLDSVNIVDSGISSSELADSSVTTAKIADLAVTTQKLANAAVTYAKTSGIAGIVTGKYTGDATSGREINLGWKPAYVMVIRGDDSKIFESLDDLTSILTWWRDNVGVLGSGLADWQGISANGFKVGTGATGGTSNANTVVYSYLALR